MLSSENKKEKITSFKQTNANTVFFILNKLLSFVNETRSKDISNERAIAKPTANFVFYIFEFSLKSLFTPGIPKGDFSKLLIFSVLPLGSGVKTIKISSLGAF